MWQCVVIIRHPMPLESIVRVVDSDLFDPVHYHYHHHHHVVSSYDGWYSPEWRMVPHVVVVSKMCGVVCWWVVVTLVPK